MTDLPRGGAPGAPIDPLAATNGKVGRAGPAEQQPSTPADLYGALLEAVQMRHLFPDGKTFVDAMPKRAVAEILEAYAQLGVVGDAPLHAFVLEHFDLPVDPDVPTVPGNGLDGPTLREHIRALWPELTRPGVDAVAGSSSLALESAFIVPGGRFRELYYWDSYFTMLGLKADDRDPMVESMLDNFATLIERHGHIPNGTRSYYLSRSQPPTFFLMCKLSATTDKAAIRRRLDAMRAEHRYWMQGAEGLDTGQQAADHVVRMPDGSLLNRYWDARDLPRDESFREDVLTAGRSGRPAAEVYRALRAGAESGWDFSSRWLQDARSLATIRTTSIIPIDLNSLLFGLEETIAQWSEEAGDATSQQHFKTLSNDRRAAMTRYLWDSEAGCFTDYDWEDGQRTGAISAAALSPLWLGAASQAQADATAIIVERRLCAPGGVRTSTVQSGQQWDQPNGWAPLQWTAVVGLERYGLEKLARTITRRWLATVEREYLSSGRLLEKYNVEEMEPGVGGEYPVQIGFGWTNGVTAALIDDYRPG